MSKQNRHWPTIGKLKRAGYVVRCQQCPFYEVHKTQESANAAYAAHANFYGTANAAREPYSSLAHPSGPCLMGCGLCAAS